MEFVEGAPLTRLIEQLGALPPARAADIARQAADALSAAHDMGIVHRDLKPDNIMVAKNRDGSDLVKVVDFGIAKAAGDERQKVTKTGLVVGTPEYMSPEQLAGDKLDGRSDIYSLGLVAFNMLTGKLPFPSESAQEAMIMRLTDSPKPLAEMKPDVAWTPEVQAVMDKVLERDANLRYQTAAQFGRELQHAIEAMPVSVAAAAGTQVMGAAAAPAAAARTAAVPATRVAGAADVAAAKPAPAATPAGKSKTPLIAAIATVVVLGSGTAVLMQMKKAPAAANAPASVTGGAADSTAGRKGGGVQPPTNTQRANGAPGGATDQLNKRQATIPAAIPGAKSPAPAPAGAAVNVDAELKRLDDSISAPDVDKPTAAAILRSMDALSDKLATPLQDVTGAIIRSSAQEVLGNHETACQIIRQVKDKALNTSKASIVTAMVAACQ